MWPTIMTIIIALILSSVAALSDPTNIIIYRQQQEALATQEDTSRAPVTNAACGQVVEGVVELNSDLNCSGDGLIVGGDDTTIRLNGHIITGLGPGTIEQFQAGILASGAEGTVISGMNLEDNQIAVISTGTEGLQAMQNDLTRNSIGMASH